MTLNTDQVRAYTTQFQANLIDNITYVLALIQHAGPVLPGELQRQALHTLRYAFQLPSAWVVTRELVTMLAPKMEQAGQREDWIPYLQQALHQSLAYHDDMTAGECHLQLAILYRLLSQFATAHTHLQAALESFTALHAVHDQGRVLNELAWLEHLQHQYAAASQHVADALALLDEDDPERGMSYRVQGMIAIDEERWQDAERLHEKALIIFEQQQDDRRIAWSLQNLANVLRGQKKYSEAIAYYQRARTLLTMINDWHNLAIVYVNLGTVYSLQRDFNLSIQHYLSALSLLNQVHNNLLRAHIYTSLGLDYLAQQQISDAETAMETSIRLYEMVGDPSGKLNATDGLAMIYLAQQNYTKAIDLLRVALADLPKIMNMPNYVYLSQSLNEHLADAQTKKSLSRFAS